MRECYELTNSNFNRYYYWLDFCFFAILGAINAKEKELADSWANLSETLNIRYLKLKNVSIF